jgi:hypothetical protein
MEQESREGARCVIWDSAAEFMLDAGGDPIAAARRSMERHHHLADPSEVGEAFGLVWSYDFLETVQRAAASGEAKWIALANEEEAAFRFEMDGYARLCVSRSAPEILCALPDDKDFADALLGIHPLVTPEIATDAARRTIRSLAQTPRVQLIGDTRLNPFATQRAEPNEAAIALHEKAKAMLVHMQGDAAATDVDKPAEVADRPGQSVDIDAALCELADRAAHEGHPLHHELRTALARYGGGIGRMDKENRAIRATPYQWTDPTTIPERPWVFGHWLLRKTAAVVVAPGGAGKSTFMAGMALSLVTGQSLLGKQVHGRKQRVWLWNLEDPLDEMQRAIQATALHYGIGRDDLAGGLYVDAAMEGSALCTAVEGRDGFKLLTPTYDAITAELIRREIDVLVIDPFVSSHEVDENDNTKLDKIAKAWARVANAANCVVVLVHHVAKSGADNVTVMSARGGKALTDACRSALVLNRMDEQTAASLGFDDAERRRYFRVSDDKHNRALAAGADWFRLASVDLGNGGGNLRPGDSVGVAEPWQRPNPMAGINDGDLAAVKDAIAGGEWRKDVQAIGWAGNAIAGALDLDLTQSATKKRVQQLLAGWIAGGDLIVVERPDASRKMRKFVEVAVPAPHATP